MIERTLSVERIGSSPWGTFGRLHLDGWECVTVEPQWRGNARGESCIPAGTYQLAMRESPVVARTSGGDFAHGWEVTGVPGRTFIMIHPGNWARNSDGCVLVGRDFAVIGHIPGVTSSRDTFADLMRRLSAAEQWDLHITWASTEYP